MMKSLKAILKRDKEKYRVPRTVQQIIPIKRIWPDGIFLVGNNYSKSWKFSDINYLVASPEDQESMFLGYAAILNSLDTGATTKITLNKHQMKKSDFEESILMEYADDWGDVFREEYNQFIDSKTDNANGKKDDKYITVTVSKKNVEEARSYFARAGAELAKLLAAIDSHCET